ncbi:MAG: transposase [Roseiflexus sp.]|jgi:hypothetical protein|nr:transposase [Roseiflexus sp.]MBO9381240.1 transposase [Roseiflexus sp.]
MENGRERSAAPDNPQRPMVCTDARPYPLLEEVGKPLPMEPDQRQRVDDAYQRHGVCALFSFFRPLSGRRAVHVTEQRTNEDVARQMQRLVDEAFPEAEVIRVVLDSLNVYTPALAYQAFSPEEARQLTRRWRFHFTSKRGSWLNMVERECSIPSRQRLGRRLMERASARQRREAWMQARNTARSTVEWRVTAANAWRKFHRFDPK